MAHTLTLGTDLRKTASGADFVIEAAPEKLELKRDIFATLDSAAPEHAILASNTSELSVTSIAGATTRAEQVVGMHWFNPPERMALIEIVQAVQTSPETVELTQAVSKRCGKTTVDCSGQARLRNDSRPHRRY